MNTFERVRKVIAASVDVDVKMITLETSLKNDLDANSLTRVEIAMALEEEFGIQIEEDETDLTTVSRIVAYIEKSRDDQK